jgi:hypothetical protein
MAVTGTAGAGGHDPSRRTARAWIALLAGPAAWAINQGVSYAVLRPVCATRADLVLRIVALVALAMTAGGVWLAMHDGRAARAAIEREDTKDVGGVPFLGAVAIWFNVLIAVLIVTSMIPQLFLDPCE